MLALIAVFFTSLVVAFSGAMMPGPLLTVTVSESTRKGVFAGPLLISGHAVLELLLVLALLFGLGPILEHSLFFIISAFVGGAIMFWMAWGMFKSLPTLSVKTNEVSKQKRNLPLTGALMSLANPYWIIWWATIGIAYIVHAQKLGLWGVAFFFVGHIMGDLIWYSAISFAIGKGKKLFTDKVYRILIAVCGAFLVGFAGYLVVSALLVWF
ncbi:MAG TPA: LysE family transporter [Prolixibacteraceae bacterium]|nr:LysE family transporter [Prolixibacteraceae bacterium]